MEWVKKFKRVIGIEEPDEDQDEDIQYEAEPKREEDSARERKSKTMSVSAEGSLQVVVVKPSAFDEVTAISNHLLEKKTVVLNCENTPKEITRRMIDFLSGVAYAIDGQLKKVAVNNYIITPKNVDISGENSMDDYDAGELYY